MCDPSPLMYRAQKQLATVFQPELSFLILLAQEIFQFQFQLFKKLINVKDRIF